jgi:hypothetical protein
MHAPSECGDLNLIEWMEKQRGTCIREAGGLGPCSRRREIGTVGRAVDAVNESAATIDAQCSAHGCDGETFRRGLCVDYYRRALPRCQVNGCSRPAVSRKMCWPHRKLWGGPVQSRPKRSSTGEGRVLAWGRLYIAADAVRRVEEEARRRGASPSGVLAEIVERWARESAGANEDAEQGGLPDRLTACGK